jgi:hypothetical protein
LAAKAACLAPGRLLRQLKLPRHFPHTVELCEIWAEFIGKRIDKKIVLSTLFERSRRINEGYHKRAEICKLSVVFCNFVTNAFPYDLSNGENIFSWGNAK